MRTIRPRHHTGAYPLVAFEVTERDAAGGIVHYNGQRLRDMRLVGMHSRNKRPASRSGNLVAPWDHERPQCFVCGGFALGDGPRCQWCTSDGRARSFCLDCGRWLPGCKCMLDAGVLVCRADEDAP